MLLNLCISFYPFLAMNNIFNNYFNKKNSRNLVAALHALFSVILNGIYLFTGNNTIGFISHCLSLGYFSFDLYYMFLFEKINLLRILFIYHHLASIYMIFNHHLIYNSHQLLFFGELSNLPSYVVYHYMHNNTEDVCTYIIIKMFKKIQKIVYGIIRIPIMTYILVNMINTLDFTNPDVVKIVTIISPVYMMGLIWTFKLICENR